MALDTVQDYVDEARRLLADTVVPYRYPDIDLIEALNISILETRRLRADLFLGRYNALPDFVSLGDAVAFDPQYRSALVYYMVGRASMRDQEQAQDSRAAAFMNKFTSQMLVIQS